jgi:hypothetical protein
MIQYIITSIIVLFVQSTFAQKTWIETGRPKPVLERNAQEIVGKKWKISFEYQASNGSEEQLAAINQSNAKTEAYFQKKKGDQWEELIQKDVQEELNNLKILSTALVAHKQAETENYVYFQKKSKSTYKAWIYPAIEPENKKNSTPLKTIKCKIEKGNVELKLKK